MIPAIWTLNKGCKGLGLGTCLRDPKRIIIVALASGFYSYVLRGSLSRL